MTNLGSHRCETCRSYTEIAFRDAMVELHICPVCQSAAILNLPSPASHKEKK